MIRKATANDINNIVKIYDDIIEKEEKEILCIGWKKGVYPIEDTARKALEREDLYVIEEDGGIVASAIINQIQVLEYKDCNWEFPGSDDEIMVLHTLVVDPNESKKGYGKLFVEFYEDFADKKGIKYLRMDTNEKNKVARRFYKKLGYTEAGIVPCKFNGIEGVELVCLEKKI